VTRYLTFLLLACFFLCPRVSYAAGAYPYRLPFTEGIDPQAQTVIGAPRDYIIAGTDTLLDVARNFKLGYAELTLAHPDLDPWVPPAGTKIAVPTWWVLPRHEGGGIVINVPELRLYYFLDKIQMVKTYPVGLGVLDWPTPFGKFSIIEKRTDPVWHIPPALHEKYGTTFIPPGPDNPLGKYWLRLSNHDYGIHGTNIPWGIGRLVSHGCIRLYPEDIEDLYRWVEIGTPVRIVYEPVKIGMAEGKVYVEVHPDLYGRIPDLIAETERQLSTLKLWSYVDLEKLVTALQQQTGIPVEVTKRHEGR